MGVLFKSTVTFCWSYSDCTI